MSIIIFIVLIYFITKDLIIYIKWFTKLKEKNLIIDSKIISKNITYKGIRTKVPVVEYIYNSKKYKSEVVFSILGGGFYFFKIGENKKIFIDPLNPSQCILISNNLLFINILSVIIFYLITILYIYLNY